MFPQTTRRTRRITAAAVLAGLGVALAAGPAGASPISSLRTWGSDRYATSVVLEDNPLEATTAYLVTGEKFPDGLTASAIAGQDYANVYLTAKAQIPQVVRERIGNAQKIVVVGSEASISNDAWKWLQQNTRAQLSRVAGDDRYATAAALSASRFTTPGVANVLVATGENYPDALAASASAAKLGVPLLLVTRSGIPAATRAELQRLAPGKITVVGGEASVSAAAAAELAGLTTGPVDRIAGADRYETSAKLSKAFFPNRTPGAYVVAGDDWPDAITAGAAAGREGHGSTVLPPHGPLLITPSTCVPQSVNLAIEAADPVVLTAVGGTDRYTDVAAKRTSCGSEGKKYLEDFAKPTGNARFEIDHATLNGVFYPRTVSYDTDPRNSEYRTWALGSKYSRFTAQVGVDDSNTSGLTSTVDVYGDERLLGSYPVSVGHSVAVDVDVRGVDNLKVVTTSSARTAVKVDDNNVYLGDAAIR
ncbi:cell wall-binding repeat-containing protein [Kineococcus rhizosphaerae]|uniref:NPCBM/NEW2 domain-containing protein n=1 Tax=Kineococcus rhizosphaerae TaxID=559628 RepID=A0A2T0R9S5_9ACTN|nr:cell wall-binding repeat-containing protein [Kineococcus rhizosphaerae]PRY17915.1 NPCBM/NEW2 domain-containing protein [Kineococcus rhizosphaerae]